MGLHDVVVVGVVAPHQRQELDLGQHPAAMPAKDGQQLELRGGELDGLPGPLDHPGGLVDDEVPNLPHG